MRRRWKFSVLAGALLTITGLIGATVPASAAVSGSSSAAAATAPAVAAAAPNCGKGVGPRKLLASYRTKRYGTSGYRTVTLYCGNSTYGYRHLEPHVGQYFGGWGNFDQSIRDTLLAPAKIVEQTNGNYVYSAPIYQCFYAGYYYIWTFFVVRTINTGTIVTAYGREGRRVNESCPV
jgi:hypothetical protein